MDRRSYLKYALATGGALMLPAGVISLVGRHGVANSPQLDGFNGRIMGTGYSVRLPSSSAESNTSSLQVIADKVFSALQDVDASMSTWRRDSELSLFNQSARTDWQSLSASTVGVLDHALQTSELSKGAFDVTIGPLVDLWGFGAGSRGNLTPSAAAIGRRLEHVGFRGVDIDLQNGSVRKHNSASALDLSGIAKGYAVDKMAAALDDLGLKGYLVEVGGELKSRGVKPDGTAWKVAIERPRKDSRDVFRILKLDNSAIATSGDYRNFYIDGGKRYSHSIDPRTGQPISNELASVSVIAASTMQADALSTAFMVMGPSDALSVAEQTNIAVHLILRSPTGNLQELYSPAFASHIG